VIFTEKPGVGFHQFNLLNHVMRNSIVLLCSDRDEEIIRQSKKEDK
jgi:hypothetical protein